MIGARDELSAPDELLLAALARRLSAVDAELPRLRSWRSDRVAAGQLHVVRGRMQPVGVSARPGVPGRARLDLAAAGVAAVLAIAVLAASRGPEVGRPGSIADASPPGPAFSFEPDGSAPSPPAPTPPTTRPTPALPKPTPQDPGRGPDTGVAPGPADTATAAELMTRVPWRCAVLVKVILGPLGSGLIDKLAVTAGERDGFIRGGFGTGWIGSDPQLAARAFKGRPLLTDVSGAVWILRGDASSGQLIRLVPERARSGATAWRSADVLWPPASCPPPGTDAKTLMLSRPPGDWPEGRIIDITVVRSPRMTTGPRQAQ